MHKKTRNPQDALNSAYCKGYDKSIKKLAKDINSKFGYWLKRGSNAYQYSKTWVSGGYFMSPIYMNSNNYIENDLNTLNTFKDNLANYLCTRYGIHMQHGIIYYEPGNISTRNILTCWSNYRYCKLMHLRFTLTIVTPKCTCHKS